MPVLFLATFFSCMSAFMGGIYIARKATKSVGITTVAAAVCNLVVDLALIQKIGLYAASGSTLVSYIFLFVFRMIDVRRLVKIKYDFVKILIPLVIIIAESVLFYIDNVAVQIINALFGFISFVLLNRAFLKQVIRKLGKRIKLSGGRHE
jgi:O-antigen/teichoic acid export membrane protein